ncbi:MAG: hypothetical protein SPL08_04945 [Pseudomonadota bacterium]|nr:hypothetical protein [Pseudomonadota bacterium]
MFLKTIVCSGINEKNDINDAIEFLKEHKNVEFGVQCSPKKASYHTPRFEWLKELLSKLEKEKIESRVALHLNEGFVVSFCDGKVPNEISDLLKIGTSVGRLQLNFKIGREHFASGTVPHIRTLEKTMKAVAQHPIILSASQPNLPFIYKAYYRGIDFDVLFDDSFGEGIVPDMRKAPLFEGVFQGYAGGLSPENISEELRKIEKVAKGAVFIDAEGKLKQDGSFSFVKAEQFVQNAIASQNIQCFTHTNNLPNYLDLRSIGSKLRKT